MSRIPSKTRQRVEQNTTEWVGINRVICGDSREVLQRIRPDSIALSVWSPPYFVGKSYERHLSYEDWEALLRDVIAQHTRILRPGAFMAVNIADILCYPDTSIPRFQAENVVSKNRLPVTREAILKILERQPSLNRYEIAERLGVSEQTVDRRLKNNNIRGGKHSPQTRVKLTGHLVEDFAYRSGLYLYDRRVWAKDPAWENSRWHSNSYRAVDEFEHIYIFWKPGITKVDRARLSREEWSRWGSRAVWHFPSVRTNDDHEAKFPSELPRRLVRLLTEPGDVVLDPFAGSGTALVTAIELGRAFLGVELQPTYAALAHRACMKATQSMAHGLWTNPARSG
ncbi:MAG: winged helix-turn-helix transcriptional regulator [Phycisphaerae bacterium]|nr:winged helix-turn-helix transcriptional regulator [Phycisphaerae bacterium]